MGQNTSPTKGEPLFKIEGRPSEHDAVIKRQGQFARVLRGQLCPCMKDGHPDLFDTKCNGKGYLYSYQKNLKITDENSPHGIICDTVIKPFWNPIVEVESVLAINSNRKDGFNAQGELQVDSFIDDEVYLESNQNLPHRYQPIRINYKFRHWDLIEETIKGTGEYNVKLPGTRFDDDFESQFISNFQRFYSDIVEVVESNFTVKRFYKQYVVFDDAVAAPTPSEDIVIKYYVSKPHALVSTNITSMLMKENDWFSASGFQAGDAFIESPTNLDVGEGDRITLMATTQRKSEIRVKSDFDKEELTEFDISDFLGFIVDEDNNKYINKTDFKLNDFNLIEWISGANKPAQGKKYSVSYEFFPTYIIFKELPVHIGHENKEWPKGFLAKKYSRIFQKQREDVVSSETVEGSGGSVDTGYLIEDIGL